ncbi:phosphoribosylglycinamide formyltransferase [Vicingus serpentipes]|uniref:Phosphoribosylglycinamide formyltransferase n=1 Tax=Vicingus serpentipes TaxID=1926625 RepID=A0A5C6RRU9_9FLAO|nr:phosphoribosylglycinamide formyltransferase [Vicingus serpentipes]TXB64684.1 phosphoribosylglycinamide formyltransferase [Vicingus serpentipes]
MTKKIAVFASGSGSNAENIFNYFKNNDKVTISLILTNNPTAGVIERANRLNIPFVVFDKNAFKNTNEIVKLLQENNIDLVVLAGFLWLIPENLIEAFPNKIVNIHPALLPKYGGKGMFGDNVHKAVVEHKETETGITIHFVNQHYDEGKVIFQAKCKVLPTDTFEEVASKIHALEYEHFPKVIADLLLTFS